MREHYYFVMNDYQSYFFKDGNTDWYKATIDALIVAAKEYSDQKEKDDNEPIHLQFDKLRERKIAPEFAIENQIGLILVLCQAYISNIISKVKYFYKDYEYFSEKNINPIPHEKKDLLGSYGNIITDSIYRDVQFIDSLANYYKHHEEWGSNNTQNKKTKEILDYFQLDTNMNIYWAQNMTQGIKVLGIKNVTECFVLLDIVNNWKKDVANAIEEINVELPRDWFKRD